MKTIEKKGFTLVELIVVITILSLFGTMMYIMVKDMNFTCEKKGLVKSSYGNSCITQKEFNEDKISSDIRFCTSQAKKIIDGTMSDTWGNDEYNTEPPTELMDKIYFDCLERFK